MSVSLYIDRYLLNGRSILTLTTHQYASASVDMLTKNKTKYVRSFILIEYDFNWYLMNCFHILFVFIEIIFVCSSFILIGGGLVFLCSAKLYKFSRASYCQYYLCKHIPNKAKQCQCWKANGFLLFTHSDYILLKWQSLHLIY